MAFVKKLGLVVSISFLSLIAIGTVIEATKSPEQKAKDAAAANKLDADRVARKDAEARREAFENQVRSGQNTIELAYIERVKDQDASYVRCTPKTLGERYFFECGLSYGGPDLANVGLWEVSNSGNSLVFYAMNGRALRALDKIGESIEFQKGIGRPSVDRAALDRASGEG